MNTVARFFGADEDWSRPGPSRAERVADIWRALAWFVVSALGLELLRSMGALQDASGGLTAQYLAIGTGSALLVWRRSHPLIVTALATAHMLGIGITLPVVMGSLPMQVLYFFAIYSGVAWARDRRLAAVVVAGVVTVMFVWLAWLFALGSGIAEMRGDQDLLAAAGSGLFPPIQATVGYIFGSNLAYFGGAILLGQVAWRGALRHAQVAGQAETIRAQSGRLRDQAVVAERLRIARELHDVVAHHVSVMGVQAAAARRVLDRDPDTARSALAAVEQSSRDAVGQMRDLLGTLRSGELDVHDAATGGPVAGEPAHDRAPQPTLAALPDLVSQGQTPSCRVDYTLVEARPGAAADVPPPVQLSTYRVVQEALANVRRHSSATRASVVVRVDADLEVEVVDNGRPRVGTSGTGLGQQGIAERAEHLGGSAQMGPRVGTGYRVLVRFPVSGRPATGRSTGRGTASEPAQETAR